MGQDGAGIEPPQRWQQQGGATGEQQFQGQRDRLAGERQLIGAALALRRTQQ
jgi:hypothetical protein